MAELTHDELKEKVVEFLKTVDKTKNSDVIKALGTEKRPTNKAINDLAKEGIVEFLYLGTSYITLANKE